MTPLRLVPNVEKYLPAIAEGAIVFARSHGRGPSVDMLAALCLRETHAGRARGYVPTGPDGSGDWTVRTGGWCRRIGVRTFSNTDGARAALITAGWVIPKHTTPDGSRVVVPGPYAIPLDGRGWGRGLFQIDALGDQRDLVMPTPWPVDRQASAACAQLELAREQLAAFAGTPLFERAILSRYNASLERVRAGLEAGDPDIGTTPSFGEKRGDYGRDVEALAAEVRRLWPDTGIVLSPMQAAGVA